MPDDIKLTRSEEYAPIGQTWQLLMAMYLDRALHIHGVTDAQQRRKILDHFFLSFDRVQDCYWFEVGDKRYFPITCFSEQYVNDTKDLSSLKELMLPPHSWRGGDNYFGNLEDLYEDEDFHEYAPGFGPAGRDQAEDFFKYSIEDLIKSFSNNQPSSE